MQKNQNKYVVLLSGGLDSSTCLALITDKAGTENVLALNAFYGQKHEKEIESARAIADYYGVDYYELNLSEIFKYSDCPLLSHSDKEIKHSSYQDQTKEGRVDTYVPFRNGLLLSTATSFAMSKGFNQVVIGVHKDDSAGNAYPDCSVQFVSEMSKAIKEGTENEVGIVAPFVNKTKADIVKEGLRLKVPYEMTWSCYEGNEEPCGTCGTCRDRIKAFEINGEIDPLMKGMSL